MKVKRKPSDGRIWLSKHYHLAQFCGPRAPNPFQVQNLFKVAAKLEALGKTHGHLPIIVRSMVTEDAQLLMWATYSPALANGEAVEIYLPLPDVDARHTVQWVTV